MHKNKIKTRGLAFAAALSLMGISLTGCQTTEKEKTANSFSDSKTNTKGTSEKKAMGRYLEESLPVPEGAASIKKLQILESGIYRILYENENYELYMAESKDQCRTWDEGTPVTELLACEGENFYISASALASDGGMFFIVSAADDNSEAETNNRCFYVSPTGSVQEMEIDDSLKNNYVFVCDFSDKNTILLQVLSNGVMELDTDGTLLNHYEKGEHTEYFDISGKYLAISINGAFHYYDLETGKPVDNMDALTTQLSENPANLELSNTSTSSFVFAKGDDSDSLFYVDSTGLYRYAQGANSVEQLIDGALNSISSPSIGLTDLTLDKDGCFYLSAIDYSSESTTLGKILKYTYDPNTSAVPENELTIYTLNESSLLKQAAIVFQKNHPDIYLNIQTGMSGDDSFTSSDAIKVLNTEIMAGKGPDLLLLDGLPEDSYIEKGLLEDISELFTDTELLENIKTAYTQEDGKIYAMPVKFGIPMIQGNSDEIASVTDLTTLADLAEAHKDEYEDFHYFTSHALMPDLLLKSLFDVNMPAWSKEDGTLDENAIAGFFEDSSRIYQTTAELMKAMTQNYGEYSFGDIASEYNRHSMGIAGSSMAVLGGSNTVGFGGLFSPSDLSYVDSVNNQGENISAKLWDGQSKNNFYPEQIVGINAKSANKDAAKEFLSFLFGEEGQKLGSENGFPVTKKVYEDINYWTQGTPGKVISSAVSSNNITGESFDLEICLPSEKVAQEIIALGKTLTVAAKDNAVIQNAVIDAGTRYINKELSLEEAVNTVKQEVNLYLSE